MVRSPHRVIQSNADVTLSRRRSNANKGIMIVAILVVLVCSVVWTIGSSLLSHSMVTNKEQEAKEKAMANVIPGEAFRMWPNDYDYMDFVATFKDCRPQSNPKCLQYVPEGTKTQRIAVLSPPGEFGRLFTNFVQAVVDSHWGKTTDLVLIPTSHVPPYGYGKTHGYTKIIRLSVSPLMTHGADVLLSLRGGDVGISDLRQVVRQLVRWHCRLSHVAAHTALLTVTFESMTTQALEVDELIREFLDLEERSPMEHMMDDGGLAIDELVSSLEDIIMDKIRTLLTKMNREVPQQIEDAIHSVIQKELDRTDNLKQWPCLSFWSVGEEGNSEALTPAAREVAKALAPNCTADFTQCGVARDRCEERGDPTCK